MRAGCQQAAVGGTLAVQSMARCASRKQPTSQARLGSWRACRTYSRNTARCTAVAYLHQVGRRSRSSSAATACCSSCGMGRSSPSYCSSSAKSGGNLCKRRSPNAGSSWCCALSVAAFNSRRASDRLLTRLIRQTNGMGWVETTCSELEAARVIRVCLPSEARALAAETPPMRRPTAKAARPDPRTHPGGLPHESDLFAATERGVSYSPWQAPG